MVSLLCFSSLFLFSVSLLNKDGSFECTRAVYTVLNKSLQFFPQTQSSTGVSSSHRLLRRPASVAGQPHHRRSKSVNHRHDDSYIMTLEVELAKQTRKVQNLKTQGVSLEMLQSEKEALRLLQDDLARAMRRTFRPANKSMSRWFTPRPQEAGEVPSGMGRKISQVVRQQLFSQQGQFVVQQFLSL